MPIGARHRRARAGTAGAYLVQGLCLAAVLTQVPALQRDFGLTDGALTVILLVVPLVAGVGSVLAGVLAPRVGSGPLLRVAGPTICLAVAATGLAGTRAGLYLALTAFGLGLGLVDATINMQGVAVQDRYGRSVLASFHGVWGIGGVLGSLANAAAGAAGVATGPALACVAALGLAVSLPAGRWLYRPQELPARDTPGDRHGQQAGADAEAGADADGGAGARGRVPWLPIVRIGLAVMVMYVADSATSNWSAKYLADALGASGGVAPLGLAAYLGFQVGGRLLADRPVRRIGPVPLVAGGGIVGMAGMAVVALAPVTAVAVAGFALVGLGLCVVIPLSFSAAGALDPTGSGAAIAWVNLFNYIGVVVGAGLIGIVNGVAGLRWAFAVPAALCVVIAALAGSFGTPRSATATAPTAAAAGAAHDAAGAQPHPNPLWAVRRTDGS